MLQSVISYLSIEFKKPEFLMGAGLITICMVINLIFVVELFQRGEFGGSNSLIDGNTIVSDNEHNSNNSQVGDTASNRGIAQTHDNLFNNNEVSNEYNVPFSYSMILLVLSIVALGITSYYSPLTYFIINLIKKVTNRS